MSEDYYLTRLFWESGRGVAKDHGVRLVLHAPPILPGLPDLAIEMIDFAPYVVAEIMPAREGRRLMTRAEIEAVQRLLEGLTL